MGFFTHLYAAGLPHRAVSVYMYLFERANREGSCFPSMSTIARELGLSLSTVKRAVADLKNGGFLTTERRKRANGGNSSLLYRLTPRPP